MGCIPATGVVFGQKCIYSGKVVVIGQKICIRAKLLYSNKSGCIR